MVGKSGKYLALEDVNGDGLLALVCQVLMDLLNNRPRKTLGYKTPNEVFFQVFPKQAA